jgi:hypothetical protein
MFLILLRAANDDVQVGFQGSCLTEDIVSCDIESVVGWARNLWRKHEKFLRSGEYRQRVVSDVIGSRSGSNSTSCSYLAASNAMSLTEVGDCLGMEALKRPTEACLLLVVASPFPSFGLMRNTIAQTIMQLRSKKLQDYVAQRISSGEGTSGVMSSVIFSCWRTFIQVPPKPLFIESNNLFCHLDGLAALDGQSSSLTFPGADSRLDAFQMIFPNYQTFRLIQSIIMLTNDNVIVVGDNWDTISSSMIAIPSLAAPMTCQHKLISHTNVDDAITTLLSTRKNTTTTQGCIVGVVCYDIPRLVLASLSRTHRECAQLWWVADTRNGTVARVATSSLPNSQILIPAADRIKDAYRKNVSLSDLHNSILETGSATFGAYRRYLNLTNGGNEINLLRLLGQSVGGGTEGSSSQQQYAIALGNAFATSSVWRKFHQTILEVESDPALKKTFIGALRSPTVNPPVLAHHANVINFQIRASKRFPELFADELMAAGRPLPKDGTAGKLFKGLLGIAKDVVSQISGPSGDIEYSRYELPYCQCQEALWSPSLGNQSTLGDTRYRRAEQLGAEGADMLLPADIVHNFRGYHELLTPSTNNSMVAPAAAPVVPPASVPPATTTTPTTPMPSASIEIHPREGAQTASALPLFARARTPSVISPVSSGPNVLDALFSSDASTIQINPVLPKPSAGGDLDSFFR